MNGVTIVLPETIIASRTVANFLLQVSTKKDTVRSSGLAPMQLNQLDMNIVGIRAQ